MTTQVHRLSQEAYEAFAKRFRPHTPNSNSTAIEVAYSLGQQAVLDALRKEIVIGETIHKPSSSSGSCIR